MKKNITSKLKIIKVFGKILLPLLIILFPFTLIAFLVSPTLFSRLIRIVFDYQFKVPPKEFLYTEGVKTISDIKYSEGNDETFDLHLPIKKDGSCPLILWAHGGAYVAGSKGYLAFFARILAHYGYAVATIDYTLAPEAHYPIPLEQIGKAYSFLVAGDYQDKAFVDTHKLFLAGDSAGAQLMAQFALLQTNLIYRQEFMNSHPNTTLPNVIPTKELRGNILYCGPFSLKNVQATPKLFSKLLFWQTGWAYFGKRRLSHLPALNEVDIIPHLTATFPPSFISDGNTLTFPKHGQDLSTALRKLEVPTTTLIFDDTQKKVYHEFFLDLATPEARQSLLTVLAFLKKYR